MTGSKYFRAWRELLIHVFKRKESRLTNASMFRHQTIGVDMSSWFQADMQLHRDFAFGVGWRMSYYAPERFMEMIQKRHEMLLKILIKPIYVFPGRPNPQRVFRDRELHAVERMRDFYRHSREHRIMNASEHKRVICTGMHQCHLVHDQMIPFLAHWMRDTLGATVMNAPLETIWQLMELERTKVTAATITSDCTMAMSGGQRILVFCKFKGNRVHYQKFDFERDVEMKKYTHDFRGLAEYLPEAMMFSGASDYYQRLDCSAKQSIQKKFPAYIIDLQRHQQQQQQYGNESSAANSYMDRTFVMAANQLRYGPVVRAHTTVVGTGDDSTTTTTDNNNIVYNIEPLNPLPEGMTWREAIGFDPIADVLSDVVAPADYGKALHFLDGHSFAISSQPSPYPGFDDMTCVMPKPHKKRPSKKEKKRLKELAALGPQGDMPNGEEEEDNVKEYDANKGSGKINNTNNDSSDSDDDDDTDDDGDTTDSDDATDDETDEK